ncbi:flavin reductase family protein [Kitasatospora brasiliensis]|uniref:flavin reductase family protein n=1 Tax=Kitasatospora brasiliensis TaxID=3058040 RepID=UPI00292D0BDD|nr:flavin reductase family protein [Kitasatospora sp. K002]
MTPGQRTRPSTQELLGGQEFRDTMSQLAAHVTVVTLQDAVGRPYGFTASSVVSASLDPPLLLLGVSRGSSCIEAISEASEFTVNLLGEGDREVARRFATSGIDRFAHGDCAPWPGHGAPYLPAAMLSARCVKREVIQVGDHDLLVAGLLEVRTGAPTRPLIWFRRDFHTAASADAVPNSSGRNGT